MDNLEDGFYKLIRLDTRISFESYYVEQKQEQYKVKLQLNKHQIDLLRYTWNQMLLEESNEDEIFDDGGIDNYDLDEEGNIEENINAYYANNDSIPGAFPLVTIIVEEESLKENRLVMLMVVEVQIQIQIL